METKSTTTSGLLGEEKKDEVKKPELIASASNDKPKVEVPKSVSTSRKPAVTTSDRPATSDETEAKADGPSPTQAELDAMREGKHHHRRRDLRGEGSTAEYKTR